MSHESSLEFGYALPGFDKYEDPNAWKTLAQTAEAAGFDTIWMSDHVTMPADVRFDDYQFDEGTPEWATVTTPYCDVFQALSFLAAVTETVTLGPNICIAPLRHPVLLAKQALTLEAVSDGRFEFGIGTGWLRSEFDVLDVPFEERGSRTDEFLDLFERARATGEASLDGPHHSFERTGFYPIPDDDGPRIWIGGHSGAAFRRVAEFGDGWTIVETDPETVGEVRDRIAVAWDDYDRTAPLQVAARANVRLTAGEEGGRPADGTPTGIGTPETVRSLVETYVASGTTLFGAKIRADSLEDECEQLERFGSEVIPAFA